MIEEIHRFSGIGIGVESGSVLVADEHIGYLENYNKSIPFKTEAVVSGLLINVQYYTNANAERANICIDVRGKKMHPGSGEFFSPARGVILVKNLVTEKSYGAKTGDKVVLFSDVEPLGKTFSGKFIGYHNEFSKSLSTGNRTVFVIESRDELQKLTGIMMFSMEGKILFSGACTGYKPGSKSVFVIFTGKKVVKV